MKNNSPKKNEKEIIDDFDIDFINNVLNNKINNPNAENDIREEIPISLEPEEDAEPTLTAVKTLEAPSEQNNSLTLENNLENKKPLTEEEELEERKKAFSKLSLEEKFKKARKTPWFKTIRTKIMVIYFFPVHKKDRIRQQKQIFIRRFNQYFGTNMRPDTVDKSFNYFFSKYVEGKAFENAIRIWIAIVAVIVLPIILYFIISTGMHHK